jgi:hypothetical protein
MGDVRMICAEDALCGSQIFQRNFQLFVAQRFVFCWKYLVAFESLYWHPLLVAVILLSHRSTFHPTPNAIIMPTELWVNSIQREATETELHHSNVNSIDSPCLSVPFPLIPWSVAGNLPWKISHRLQVSWTGLCWGFFRTLPPPSLSISLQTALIRKLYTFRLHVRSAPLPFRGVPRVDLLISVPYDTQNNCNHRLFP